MDLEHFAEPELEFASGQRHVDIRFGLMNFGPLDRGQEEAPRRIRIGVVGTAETCEGISRWLELCRAGVPGRKTRQPNLFPRFPAFDSNSTFECELVLSSELTSEISPRSIDRLTPKVGNEAAIREIVELFLSHGRHLIEA